MANTAVAKVSILHGNFKIFINDGNVADAFVTALSGSLSKGSSSDILRLFEEAIDRAGAVCAAAAQQQLVEIGHKAMAQEVNSQNKTRRVVAHPPFALPRKVAQAFASVEKFEAAINESVDWLGKHQLAEKEDFETEHKEVAHVQAEQKEDFEADQKEDPETEQKENDEIHLQWRSFAERHLKGMRHLGALVRQMADNTKELTQ